jgi:hypothetical protein
MIFVIKSFLLKIVIPDTYKNTSLGAIRLNYPLKEVRTSHVSLNRLL